MLWSYARRLLLAIIILSLYKYPFAQILVCLVLQIYHMGIILAIQPYEEDSEHRTEVNNEYATILT